MPHEKAPSSHLSDTLDRRRALILSSGSTHDSCQTKNPLRIFRRSSKAQDKESETSEDPKSSTKIHWKQLTSNGTFHQLDPTSHRVREQEIQEIQRHQVKVVLEDVLQTEMGQRFLRGRGQSFLLNNHSEHKSTDRQRRSDQTRELKDTRTSVTLRGKKDSAEANNSSSSHRQTESTPSSENESCSSKDQEKIKHSRVRQTNFSLKHSESSEESSNWCSPRESDSPPDVKFIDQLSKQTAFKEKEASSSEGSLPNDDVMLLACEELHSPLSLEDQCNLNEDKPDSEHVTEQTEEEETNECSEDTEDTEDSEEEILKRRNGEMVQELEGSRCSVLRLSVGAEGQVPIKRSRLDSLSGEGVLGSDSRSEEGQPCQPLQTVTIVLSSEEEEEESMEKDEEENVLDIQPPEDTKEIDRLENAESVYEQIAKSSHSHIIGPCTQNSSLVELRLSSFHIGGVSAMSNENMKMTTKKITISLKDSAAKISISMACVCKYSVWDGIFLKGCELVKDEDILPSLLLIWLSDTQARQLHKDLSVIQPETTPDEGSTCLVLCLAEPVAGIESAMLASLMDIVALDQESPELHSPLTHSESLKLLQRSQETHLLKMLTSKSDAQSSTAAQTPSSADSDVQRKPVYTVCHKRCQGSYSASMEPMLGSEWTPYRHQGPIRRLIQFPPPPSKGALTVTTEDLECLDSGEFLNDVIIDFYLKYLFVQKAPQSSVERSHVFSSFFYKQLTRRDNANEDVTSTPAQARRHQRVRTWTRHVDIFDKDFLFIPVNQESHWYLVVICFPGLEEPEYVTREGFSEEALFKTGTEIQSEKTSNNDEGKNSEDGHKKASNSHEPLNCTESTCKRQTVCKRPCILIMDSLKLSLHERIFKLLREYLQAEWEVKRGVYRDFSVENMEGSHCKVPLQDNSSDCGLYLLQYAESFLQDPVVHFDLPLRLERWFHRQRVRGKREEIRDLILHLYRFQQGSFENEALIDGIDRYENQ